MQKKTSEKFLNIASLYIVSQFHRCIFYEPTWITFWHKNYCNVFSKIWNSNHAVYIFKKTTKTTTTKTITCITICISPTFFNALYTPFFPYFFRSHIPSRHEREVSEFRKLEREKSFDEGNYLQNILFSSNHNIHKNLSGLCFWASDPLIKRF